MVLFTSASADDDASVATLESTGQQQQHDQHDNINKKRSLSLTASGLDVHADQLLAAAAVSFSFSQGAFDKSQPRRRRTSTASSSSFSSKRKVRFAAPIKVRRIPVWWEMKVRDLEQIWYDADDYERFRLESKQVAQDTRDYGGPLVTRPIDLGYAKAQKLAAASAADEEEEEDFAIRGQKLMQALLLPLWSKRRSTGRGLEHKASKAHHAARSQAKENVYKHAIRRQDDESTPLQDATAVAQGCQEASRCSRILARWLGEADAQFRIASAEYHALEQQIMDAYYAKHNNNNDLDDSGEFSAISLSSCEFSVAAPSPSPHKHDEV